MDLTGVRADDVRALWRLAGEARELVAARKPSSLHVVKGLGAIIGAALGIEFTGRLQTKKPLAIEGVVDFGWPSESDRARVYGHLARLAPDKEPMVAELMRRQEPIVTLARADVATRSQWCRTELAAESHSPAGIDDCIVSMMRGDEGTHPQSSSGTAIHALVFKRGRGDPDFGARERDLVHLFVSESSWIYERPANVIDALGGASLSPREREALRLLLTEASEKDLAVTLGVSRHTAHEYVRVVYRKMQVRSRAELMARAVKLAGLVA